MELIKVLLVDDRRENLLALESLLKNDDVQFIRAGSGVEALELLLKHEFALAMIDVQMPDMDGLELAEFMRGANETKKIPIIFVTAGARDGVSTFKGYEKGAVDYLYKPLDPVMVRSKVQVFLELAKQRQLLNHQLQETQKALIERDSALQEAHDALGTRDDFISVASHELKTPLTSLHLQLQMVMRGIKREKDISPSVQKISHALAICERQSSKLSQLLDELLDLTRVRLGKLELQKEEMDLVKVVREVLSVFQQELDQANYKVSVEGPATILGEWDRSRIEQVITNLLSNAIKYGERKPIEIALSQTRGRAIIIVRDHGMGIPQDLQGKIFKRFERAIKDQNIAGLGLGLYITRQIVEAHGGVISVSSRQQQGCTFTVELPLQKNLTFEPFSKISDLDTQRHRIGTK